MAMSISIYTSDELQAVITRLRELPNEISKQIRKATRADALPIWQETLRQRPATRLETQVLISTARVAVSSQNITLSSATVGRKLAGGLQPKLDFAGVEFGANPQRQRTYTQRSRSGRTYSVTRHTQKNLRPRKHSGYVVMPAAAHAIPRIASLWVQTVMRATFEAFGE